jgi:hypothetical protein
MQAGAVMKLLQLLLSLQFATTTHLQDQLSCA